MKRIITMKKISTLPITIYRLQNTKAPKLREKLAQQQKNLSSFDFKLGENGLYNPAKTETYNGPNGLSLRPLGMHMAEYLEIFEGGFIYEMAEGLVIPKEFILYHEHSDHFSLQTAQPIKPKQFCRKVELFLQQQKPITKKELLEKLKIYWKNK